MRWSGFPRINLVTDKDSVLGQSILRNISELSASIPKNTFSKVSIAALFVVAKINE